MVARINKRYTTVSACMVNYNKTVSVSPNLQLSSITCGPAAPALAAAAAEV